MRFLAQCEAIPIERSNCVKSFRNTLINWHSPTVILGRGEIPDHVHAYSTTNTNDTPSPPLWFLIIDDDRELCESPRDIGSMGFTVEIANDVHEGIRRSVTNQFAVTVLDVMLPGLDGFEALRRIGANSGLLGADADSAANKWTASLGWYRRDAYLPQPFNPARIGGAHSGHTSASNAENRASPPSGAIPPLAIVGDLKLDPVSTVRPMCRRIDRTDQRRI